MFVVLLAVVLLFVCYCLALWWLLARALLNSVVIDVCLRGLLLANLMFGYSLVFMLLAWLFDCFVVVCVNALW